MTSWLWQSALLLSALATILLLGHAVFLRYLGARTSYSLWLLLPSTLVLPLLPTIPITYSPQVIQQWLITPEAISHFSSQGSGFNLALLWLLGFCCVITWYIFSYCTLTKQLNGSRYFTLGKLRCYRQFNTGPAIFGFWRPTLLIPTDFKQRFTKQERHLILQHERAHWQAGDLHFNLIALLLVALYWFSPVVWLAYRRFRADQELACDERVLAKYSSPVLVCYANALLAAMQSVPPAAHSHLLSPHYGATKLMTERLNNLTTQKTLYKQPLLLCLMVMLMLAMSWQPIRANQAAAANTPSDIATPIVRIEPRYPIAAAQQGITGWVQLGFTIDNNGMVAQPKVLAAHPEGVFNEEALKAVSKWRYSPDNAGKTLNIELQFALDSTAN